MAAAATTPTHPMTTPFLIIALSSHLQLSAPPQTCSVPFLGQRHTVLRAPRPPVEQLRALRDTSPQAFRKHRHFGAQKAIPCVKKGLIIGLLCGSDLPLNRDKESH
jgi:hypothetical protein